MKRRAIALLYTDIPKQEDLNETLIMSKALKPDDVFCVINIVSRADDDWCLIITKDNTLGWVQVSCLEEA